MSDPSVLPGVRLPSWLWMHDPMKTADCHYAELVELLEQGWTVIMGHDRLARHLRRRFAEVQALRMDADNSAWASPLVMTEATYLRESYNDAALAAPLDKPLPLLLSDRQASMIWGQEIHQDRLRQAAEEERSPEELLGARGAADTARNARRTLKRLQQEPWDEGRHYNSDPRAFLRFLRRVEKRYADNHWIELADVPGILMDLLRGPQFPQDALPVKGRIVFAGFAENWPELRALADALGARLVPDPVVEIPASDTKHVQCWKVADYGAETEAACQWAVDRLNQWLTDANASPIPPRIGIAVLQSATRMEPMGRVLTHLLDGEGLALQAGMDYDPRRYPFTVQNPRPLTSFAPVRMAMMMLTLDREVVPSQTLSDILRSPFLRVAGRQQFRIHNEEPRLRENWPPLQPWESAFQSLTKPGISHPVGILRELLGLPGMQDSPRPLGAWAVDWAEVLSKGGWPRGSGEGLDSATFQVVKRFQEVLTELASLDLVADRLPDRQAALGQLEILLRSTQFQLEGSLGPIEVFDAEECAGLEFDALFLCGFVDEVWPPVPVSNHFLPPEQLITRDRGGLADVNCPRATADGAREHARNLTNQLLRCAREVVIGLPANDGQSGRILRPSHLLPEVQVRASREAPYPAGMQWARATVAVAGSLANGLIATPETPVPVEPAEAARTTGGSYLVRSQSQCPVQALLKYRVGLRPMEDQPLGLGPKEQGTVVHGILDYFWAQLPVALGHDGTERATYALLAAEITNWTPGDKLPKNLEYSAALDTHIRASVRHGVGLESVSGILGSLPAIYRETIAEALRKILLSWIQVELANPFDAFVDLEADRSLSHRDLAVRVTVDRMHCTMDGDLAIVDYKGSAKKADDSWFGCRPQEPQLPLYAAIAGREGMTLGELVFGIYGSKASQVRISPGSIIGKVPSNEGLLAELIGSGTLCAGDWTARLRDKQHPLDQQGIFAQITQNFEPVIEELIDGYLSGSPILDPLPLPGKRATAHADDRVCLHCDYGDVCRIREWLADGPTESDWELDGGEEVS